MQFHWMVEYMLLPKDQRKDCLEAIIEPKSKPSIESVQSRLRMIAWSFVTVKLNKSAALCVDLHKPIQRLDVRLELFELALADKVLWPFIFQLNEAEYQGLYIFYSSPTLAANSLLSLVLSFLIRNTNYPMVGRISMTMGLSWLKDSTSFTLMKVAVASMNRTKSVF